VPTYSYACTECSNRFDAVQAFSDAALTTCPECNGRLRKLFGNVGVVFKGSGFYRNDARSDAKSSSTVAASGTDTPSTNSASSESTSSSDSKKSESSTSSSATSTSSASSSSGTAKTAAAAP